MDYGNYCLALPNWTVDVVGKKTTKTFQGKSSSCVVWITVYLLSRVAKENGGLDEDGESVGASM